MNSVPLAIEKMQCLSPERMETVVTLIDDLASLEAREDAEDALLAEAALEAHRRDGGAISLEELEARIGF